MSSRSVGARLPVNYQTILAIVSSLGPGAHLSAADVYVRARALRPKIGFVTVHRGLARLHELGYVLKLDMPGAPSAVYEPAASPHAHFRCRTCGRIDDLPFTVPQDTRSHLESQYGLRIDGEAVTFSGNCRGCTPA